MRNICDGYGKVGLRNVGAFKTARFDECMQTHALKSRGSWVAHDRLRLKARVRGFCPDLPVSSCRITVYGLLLQILGLRVLSLGFGVWGFGFRV